ncbi:Beta-1 [Blattella germanica]|nr:Beta-1 [Blattella germanica]
MDAVHMREPLLCFVLFVSLAKLSSGETLIWQDEFDTLDLNQWSHLVTAWGGGNSEFQYYRNDRRNRAAGNDIVQPLQSARLSSSFSFKYGRVEIRAQMPRGDWIWPAIWMLPKNSEYGSWPRSGEIDIIEVRANDNYYDGNGVSQGIDRMGSTMHWGPDPNHNAYWRTHWEKDFADDYHLFGIEWTENHIKYTVDNEEIGTIWAPQDGFWYFGEFHNNPGGENIWQYGSWLAPFDKEFNFILNVAVGGSFFADGVGNRPWDWNSGHPMRDFWERRSEWLPTWHEEEAAMKIDYIRVYSL